MPTKTLHSPFGPVQANMHYQAGDRRGGPEAIINFSSRDLVVNRIPIDLYHTWYMLIENRAPRCYTNNIDRLDTHSRAPNGAASKVWNWCESTAKAMFNDDHLMHQIVLEYHEHEIQRNLDKINELNGDIRKLETKIAEHEQFLQKERS